MTEARIFKAVDWDMITWWMQIIRAFTDVFWMVRSNPHRRGSGHTSRPRVLPFFPGESGMAAASMTAAAAKSIESR